AGILFSTYLVSENLRRLGEGREATKCLLYGIILQVCILTFLVFHPNIKLFAGVSFLQLLLLAPICKDPYPELVKEHFANGAGTEPLLKVVGIGLLACFAMIGLTLLISLVKATFFQ